MRYNELYEDGQDYFMALAKDIWAFANGGYSDEEKKRLSSIAYNKDTAESGEGYLWRMVKPIKYDGVWQDYQELGQNMAANVYDHDKYHQIKRYLEQRR